MGPAFRDVDTDIVVVGAGVIGAAAAWQLAGRGHEVLLLDRFDAGHRYGASHGSARLLRPAGMDDRHLPLALSSWSLWRELETQTGAELVHACGAVDHGEPVHTARLAERLTAHGVEHRWLTPDDAAARWPGLLFTGPVLYQAGRTGRIHADLATAALVAAAVGHGAQVRRGVRVESIAVRGPDRVRVSTSGGVLRARRVVVAAGAWTSELLPGSVGLPPLRVTQEQPALFPPRAINPCVARDTDWPTVVHHFGPGLDWPGRGSYAVADPCGDVKVGFDAAGPVCHPDRRTFVPEPEQLRRLQRYVALHLPGLDMTGRTRSARPAPRRPMRGRAHRVRSGRRGSRIRRVRLLGRPAVGRALADLATGRADRSGSGGSPMTTDVTLPSTSRVERPGAPMSETCHRCRRPGATVWLTGLPSAGKSTIAHGCEARLLDGGTRVEVLDGDAVRPHLAAARGYSREDRAVNIRRIGWVAELLARNGVLVLVSAIAPFRDVREQVRAAHASAGTAYLEVHVSTPVEVAAERDVKGLYARQREGEISGLTGVDDPYEVPVAPDLVIPAHRQSVDDSVTLLVDHLTANGFVGVPRADPHSSKETV